MKQNRVAYGVRVKLSSQFHEKCLGDKYLKKERILFIADEKPCNDSNGYYVNIKGGSLVNSGQVYLNEIDLEFEVPEYPLYPYDEKNLSDRDAAKKHIQKPDYDTYDYFEDQERYSAFLAGCKFKEEQIKDKTNITQTINP